MAEMDILQEAVQAIAVIDGVGEVDIAELELRYSLNEVPEGHLTLALGRDMGSGKQSKPVEFQKRTPITIKVKHGDGDFVSVFSGYLVGGSAARTFRSAGLAVHVLHWLDDLRTTSPMSKYFSPSSLMDLIQPARIMSTNTAKVASPEIFGMSMTTEADFGKSILAMLNKLATSSKLSDRGAIVGLRAGISAAELETNPVVLATLEKIISGLVFRPDVQNSRSFKQSAGRQAGSTIFGASGGPTAWSRLIELGQLFSFFIVPLVDEVKLVPIVLGGSVANSKVILPSEYFSADKLREIPPSIRGVIIYATMHGLSHGDRVPLLASNYIGAYLEPKKDGMLEVLQAPIWLNLLANEMSVSSLQTSVNQDGTLKGAEQPREGRSPVGDLFAKAKYYDILAVGRAARLTGKLRFDIGPGTPVRLTAIGTKVGENYADQNLRATVWSTTIQISAGNPSASTSFQLVGVRGENEGVLTGEHPMYVDAYKGDALAAAGAGGISGATAAAQANLAGTAATAQANLASG